MRAVVQRVSHADVFVDNKEIGRIGRGIVILLGIHRDDSSKNARKLAEKISCLRIFDDENNRMNCSLIETAGSALIVSQFTLYGDCRKGRRPDYNQAAPAETAQQLYDEFVTYFKSFPIQVETGIFAASMKLTLANDGPVTLILDTAL